MVPRKPKLIAAAAVLAAGIGLAWPWRRSESLPATALPIAKPAPTVSAAPASFASQSPASNPAPLAATTIGLGVRPADSPFASADAPPQSVTVAKPIHYGSEQLAPLEVAAQAPQIELPAERTHVVHEGDSLEGLAKRYLGDEGRAIELFDLNRQVLENPHLLKLGAELKIPRGTDASPRTKVD